MKKWKTIKGFEKYEVSNYGDVMSLDYNDTGERRLRKPKITNKGYVSYGLCKNGKTFWRFAHRLAASAFIGAPKKGFQINHKNGNKKDNRVDNLEWVTPQRNLLHAIETGLKVPAKGEEVNGARLNKFQVQRMRLLKEVDQGISIKKLSELFNMSYGATYAIIKRISWQHV